MGFYVLISLGTRISIPELLLFQFAANVSVATLMILTTVMTRIYAENEQFYMKAVLFPNVCVTKERKWAQKYAR